MSTPTQTTSPAAPADKPYCPVEWVKKHATVYHLTVAAVLGAATAGFTVVIALLILVSTNFNVLGWTE